MLCNAAREPEIVDLQNFLNACGADVRGAGSSTIVVQGGRPLHDCEHTIIADRIVAATYLSAAAAAGGDVLLRRVDYRHLSTVTAALKRSGLYGAQPYGLGPVAQRWLPARHPSGADGALSRLPYGCSGCADGGAAESQGHNSLYRKHF